MRSSFFPNENLIHLIILFHIISIFCYYQQKYCLYAKLHRKIKKNALQFLKKIRLRRAKSFATRQAFTCSKLTIETLQQGVKYVQVNNKDIRTTSNFEHVIAGWVSKCISIEIAICRFSYDVLVVLFHHILTFKKQPLEIFCNTKSVLRDFAKFPGKHLCQSLFLNKVAAKFTGKHLCQSLFLKKKLWHR